MTCDPVTWTLESRLALTEIEAQRLCDPHITPTHMEVAAAGASQWHHLAPGVVVSLQGRVVYVAPCVVESLTDCLERSLPVAAGPLLACNVLYVDSGVFCSEQIKTHRCSFFSGVTVRAVSWGEFAPRSACFLRNFPERTRWVDPDCASGMRGPFLDCLCWCCVTGRFTHKHTQCLAQHWPCHWSERRGKPRLAYRTRRDCFRNSSRD